MISRIFYRIKNQDLIATGEILEEDEKFIHINDRYEGEIRIGKNFIIKIRKEENARDNKQNR